MSATTTTDPLAPVTRPTGAWRLLHVSDWHLGKRLGACERTADMLDVLEQTVQAAQAHRPDLVLHTGDLFDLARPALPDLDLAVKTLRRLADIAPVVMLAGNHDSPEVFAHYDLLLDDRIRLISRPRSAAQGGLVEIPSPHGGPGRLRVACLPFIHANRIIADLENPDARAAKYTDRISALIQTLGGELKDATDPATDIAVLAGHLHLSGAQLSRSERPLEVSEDYAARPASLPPTNYVALGHIHKPQDIPGGATGRYVGSPIPLDFGEESYTQRMLLVDLAPAASARITDLPYRIARPLRRFDGTLQELAAQAESIGSAICRIVVRTDTSEPDLHAQVSELLPHATLLEVVNAAADTQGAGGLTDTGTQDQGPVRSVDELFVDYVTQKGTGGAGVSTEQVIDAFGLLWQSVQSGEAPRIPELTPPADQAEGTESDTEMETA